MCCKVKNKSTEESQTISDNTPADSTTQKTQKVAEKNIEAKWEFIIIANYYVWKNILTQNVQK